MADSNSVTWRDMEPSDLLREAMRIDSILHQSRLPRKAEDSQIAWKFTHGYKVITCPEVECPWCQTVTTSPIVYIASHRGGRVNIKAYSGLAPDRGQRLPRHPHYQDTGDLCYEGNLDTAAWAIAKPNPDSPLWGGSNTLQHISTATLREWDRYAIFHCAHDCSLIRQRWGNVLTTSDIGSRRQRVLDSIRVEMEEVRDEVREDAETLQTVIERAVTSHTRLSLGEIRHLLDRQRNASIWTDEWAGARSTLLNSGVEE